MKNIFKDKNTAMVAKNMVIGILCKPASVIVSFIYVPIVLNYLGDEKYGVWSTILSIVSWIGYLDVGIGNGLRNKLTVSLAQKETALSKKLVSSTYAMITSIMAVVIIIVWSFSGIISWEDILGIETFDENLGLIVSLSITFVAINFVLSISKNVLFAMQKAFVASLMEPLTQVLNLLAVLVVSRIVCGSLLLIACIYGLAMVLSSFFVSILIYGKNVDLRPSVSAVDFKVGASLTNLGLQFFLIQICAMVLFTTDNLIISSLYGASDVTPYNMVNKLFNVISFAYIAMLTPIWSSVTKAKAEKNYVWIKKSISRLQLLMIPFFAGAALLALIFKAVSEVWLGRALAYHPGLIVLGALYCILTIWCNTYAYVANGLEMMKPSMVVAAFQAVANIPLSLFFAEVVGMQSAGVLAGTVVSMLIAAIATPIYVHIEINRQLKAKGSDIK